LYPKRENSLQEATPLISYPSCFNYYCVFTAWYHQSIYILRWYQRGRNNALVKTLLSYSLITLESIYTMMASGRNIQCFNEKIVLLLFDTFRVYLYSDNIKDKEVVVQLIEQGSNRVNSLGCGFNHNKYIGFDPIWVNILPNGFDLYNFPIKHKNPKFHV